ncbi:hypothetical protein EXIGLDRAFT_829485 [Exidia glandulosa HHB12029]|uniref:Protein kinase domain-containing protein n=1 Tax=Exidia glandulosa HHB12029 TaxID=1314781 RepID=A0A165PKB9_EXIGL|nr:hypothetical protein EXIGLDRAFT_829485 [Exidia glandulosa HHB12029]
MRISLAGILCVANAVEYLHTVGDFKRAFRITETRSSAVSSSPSTRTGTTSLAMRFSNSVRFAEPELFLYENAEATTKSDVWELGMFMLDL